jgi:AbrB family looped-hinge helix DNA binding protein
MVKHNRVTTKGQVTIPKDVRDALGVKPGDAVAFERAPDGSYVLKKAQMDPREYERRYQEALDAIREVRRKHPAISLGMTTDEYMAMIREPVLLP